MKSLSWRFADHQDMVLNDIHFSIDGICLGQGWKFYVLAEAK